MVRAEPQEGAMKDGYGHLAEHQNTLCDRVAL